MRYIVIKDVKSNPSKASYTIIPAGDKDAEEFARTLVRVNEGSVKECDSFDEVRALLRPKAEAKDDVYAYAGEKTIKTFDILNPANDESALRRMFEPLAEAGAPATDERPQPVADDGGESQQAIDLSEARKSLHILRGLVNDISTCRYGVSISTLAKQALAELDYLYGLLPANAGQGSR